MAIGFIEQSLRLSGGTIKKRVNNLQIANLNWAEREGFEPPVPFSTPVFKPGAQLFNSADIALKVVRCEISLVHDCPNKARFL